jgi:ADP-ribose pyrophosphatase YjhB (NUDIX family)
MNLVARTAGRLLIIDAAHRVLLINEAMRPDQPYWLVPGGGVEDAESPRDAALRETYEETGLRLTLPPDAQAVSTERRTWSYAATSYDQTNHFFTVRVGDADTLTALSASQHTELERETFLGFRWWHPDEIDASSDQFYPAGLADLVRGIVAARSAELA